MLNDSCNCFPASEHSEFLSVADTMPEYLRNLFIRSSKELPFFQYLDVAYLLIEIGHVFFKKLNSILVFSN